MDKNKKIILLIIGIILLWNFVFISIIYFVYMSRVENTFKSVKDSTINSKVLENEIGKVKKVKFNNFMQWISSRDNESCIKIKVYTKDKKYNVCAILATDKIEKIEDVKVTGYFINDKKYEEAVQNKEKVSISTFMVNSRDGDEASYSSNDLEIDTNLFNTYKEIINSKSVKNKIKQKYSDIIDIELGQVKDTGILKAIYVCKEHSESECIDINNQYVSLFIDNIVDIYNVDNVSIVDSATIFVR